MLVAFSIATIFSISYYYNSSEFNSQLDESPKIDKKTRADLANAQNFQMVVDPSTGTVPRERLWKTVEMLRMQEGARKKAAIADVVWSERGPNNVGGRTRAIMFDPNDATKSRVFSAGVAGGLWVCDNIYATTPAWTAIDNFFDNLAITTLAFDPTDKDTMYFGTGEGYSNLDAVRGDGIWRSVDGGVNWTQLANTTGASYNYVQKVVVDASGNVYAATRSGVFKSTDNGSTWSTILSSSVPSSGTNASSSRAADLELASNGDLYAAMGIFATDGVYKSTDAGSTWTQVYSASGEQRIEIACAPSNSDYVYMITQSSSTYEAASVQRTTNGGTSWSTLTNPNDGVSSDNFCRNQAWYDLSLAVDPTDEDNAFIGGVDLFKTTNGGSTWTQVSHWYGGGGFPEVHADQHIALYASGSTDTMLFGNDGGIYLTTNATSSTPSFSHQVASYNVTQFYSGAIHPTANTHHFLAGAQDNGSHRFSSAGMNSTVEVTGGDGAFVHIDQDDPTYQFTSYVYNQYRRSTNGGSSFSSINFSSSAGKFINPTDYDNDAQILYGSWNADSFMRWTNPRSGSTYSLVEFGSASGQVSAVACDPNTANRIYLGTDNGEVWQIDNAHSTITATDVSPSGMSSGHYVSCIAIQNGDANHLLATVSNYGVTSVYESTNAGSSWTSVEGNLPDMPIRWAIFSPIGGDSALLATELGVWSTDNLNGGSTSWAATNTGLANVRTDMLQVRLSDSTVIAATHGRGLYSYSFSEIVNPGFMADKTVVYPCETVTFTDTSIGATSWAWDFNNDGNTDATAQNPTWTYNSGGYKTVKLVINGTDSITTSDYITVLPKLGTPYTAANGGNFESNLWHFGSASVSGSTNLWELGAPSNAISTTASGSNVWKTDLDADILKSTYSCALYTPSFNFSATGTYDLSFDYRMEAAHSQVPIGVYVEYSTNQGSSWSQLGTYNAGNNWYSTSSHLVVSSGTCWSATQSSYVTATVDASALAGNHDVRFRIVLQVADGWSLGGNPTIGYAVDGFSIDDFEISGPTNEANAWEVETALNATSTEYLGPNDTVNFVSSNCKIIAQVINLSTHDYGMTTVTIDNAGSGTMDFSTNTDSAKEIMEKTITITPTTNNGSGSVKITNYYTNAESSAWKTATGWNCADLTQIKSSGAISSGTLANTVYGASTVLDSTYSGSNVSITCSYTNGFSGLGAGKGGSSGPLPIHLLSFEGERHLSHSLLKWQTSMEKNSSHFEIERRNGNQFIKIGKVEASTNTSSITNYSYNDENELSNERVLVYRLKMVDHDGSFKYSNLLFLSLDANEMRSIVLPNPINNVLTVTLTNREVKPFDLVFTNIEGIEMKKISNVVSSQRIDVGDLSSGLYFLTISRGNNVIETKKITVLK